MNKGDKPRIVFPGSKVVGDASRVMADITRQSRLMSDVLRPFLEHQRAASEQMLINSDYFRSHVANQGEFARVSSRLAKSLDLGPLTRIVRQAEATQRSWLKDLEPMLARLDLAFYPPNLRGIPSLRITDVQKVVFADGIALYGVPRRSIAKSLVRADSASKRRAILGRRWKDISVDCREAVEQCTSETVQRFVPFALAALDAIDAENTTAAQATSASLLESLIEPVFGNDRKKFLPNRRTTNSEAYERFHVRRYIATIPIVQAFQKCHTTEGDRIPTTFSRHATAHTVSPRQYNRRNAVQGLLLACSLIYYLNEQADN